MALGRENAPPLRRWLIAEPGAAEKIEMAAPLDPVAEMLEGGGTAGDEGIGDRAVEDETQSRRSEPLQRPGLRRQGVAFGDQEAILQGEAGEERFDMLGKARGFANRRPGRCFGRRAKKGH